MKVLVTGITAKQIGSKRSFQIALNSGSIVQALQEGGHEVDWRAVVPGEDLSTYDRVFVYLGLVNSLSSQYAFGVLWALATRPDAYLALDDWQVKAIASAAKAVCRKGADELFKPAIPKNHREEAEPHKELLFNTLKELTGDTAIRRTCFTPMFRRGKPEKLGMIPVKRHVVFDPTTYWIDNYSKIVAEAREKGQVTEKQRTWIHAALVNKSEWIEKLQVSWPIQAYGNIKEKQPRVPEAELVPIIAGSWGLLSAAHNTPSSGWWRVRFAIAAACDTIVFGDANEMYTVYGEAFSKWPSDIERMSDEQLKERANKQKDLLIKQMMTQPELIETINKGISLC